MRDHDHVPAERFVAALRALDDEELLAVVQPLVDVQKMVLDGKLRGRQSLATLIRRESGNPKAIEFLEAVGSWVFAELHHRDQILADLDGGG